MTGLLLLAAVEEEDVGTGPIGLLIVLVMLIATFFLIRNMGERLKRLPREFPDPSADDQQDESQDGQPDGTGTDRSR